MPYRGHKIVKHGYQKLKKIKEKLGLSKIDYLLGD